MLKIKKLSKEEVVSVYEQHLLQDFVPAEQKPLEIILRLMSEERYLCYGLYDRDEFVAYAFFCSAPKVNHILIDYLAVCEGKRNFGYGSKFLQLLQTEITEYASIIFEVESGKSAENDDEILICKKRLDFYHRNGLKDTKLSLSLFGVDMNILYLTLDHEPTDDEVYDSLDVIYDLMFGQELHRKRVLVSKNKNME